MSQLVDEALLGSWDRQGGNANVIRNAMRDVNYKCNTSFDFRYYRMRVGKFRNHFRVFKWITSLSDVAHDEITNKVECIDDACEFICEKEKLASYYMEKGDIQFDSLKCLFQVGPDSEDGEKPKVINIISDEEDKGFEIPVDIDEGRGRCSLLG